MCTLLQDDLKVRVPVSAWQRRAALNRTAIVFSWSVADSGHHFENRRFIGAFSVPPFFRCIFSCMGIWWLKERRLKEDSRKQKERKGLERAFIQLILPVVETLGPCGKKQRDAVPRIGCADTSNGIWTGRGAKPDEKQPCGSYARHRVRITRDRRPERRDESIGAAIPAHLVAANCSGDVLSGG